MECRLCLRELTNELINIFGRPDSLVLKVWKCCQLQVTANDGLPDSICTFCISKLDLFSEFKDTCERNDEILRQRINNSCAIKVEEVMLDDEDFGNLSDTDSTQVKYQDVKEEAANTTDDSTNPSETDSMNLQNCNEENTNEIDSDTNNDYKLDSKPQQKKKNCSVTVNQHQHLKKHVIRLTKTNLQTRVYTCDYCMKDFQYRGNLTRHIKLHSGNKQYSCRICFRQFTYNHYLQSHIKNVHKSTSHPKLIVNICNYCNKEFVKKSNLVRHIVTLHSDKVSVSQCNNVINITCVICSQSFKSHYSLKKHMISVHHFSYRNICEYCGKGFHTNTDLIRHVTTHTGRRLYRCKICPKTFNKKHALLKHAKVHSNKLHFICNCCGKGFQHMKNLRDHIRASHLLSLKFQCDHCEKFYYIRKALVRHMKLHSNCY